MANDEELDAKLLAHVMELSLKESDSELLARKLHVGEVKKILAEGRNIQKNPKNPSKGAGESSKVYHCLICRADKKSEQMFPISGCSDTFCVDCISEHVETKLGLNETKIKCPMEGCGFMLEFEECRRRLPEAVVGFWKVLRSTFPCPFKECSIPLPNDNQGGIVRETECPHCYKKICAQCKVPWHKGMSCEEYQAQGEDERRRVAQVLRLAKEKKWHQCPNCGDIGERTEVSRTQRTICRIVYNLCLLA